MPNEELPTGQAEIRLPPGPPGHRRCIGAAFATYEMAIVLGTILSKFELELVESKPVVPKRRNVTIGPSSGVPIRVKAKRL